LIRLPAARAPLSAASANTAPVLARATTRPTGPCIVARVSVIRVFACDDMRPFTRLVELWLDEARDIDFVGAGHDPQECRAGLTRARPDVVLLDTMTGFSDPFTIDQARELAPGAKILVLSGHPPDVARSLVREADGYLMKSSDPNELVTAIRSL
jgi:DNA-binding NarL/FixJ family response regulator